MKRKNNRSSLYAMVTGGSSGIGAEFAKRFAKAGYSLILVARTKERLEKQAEQLRKWMKNEQEIILIPADLNFVSEVKRIFQETQDKNLYIFINNAGFGDCGYFLETEEEKELSMIDVNVKAMHLAMKLALKRMQRADRGYILNVASSAGLLPAGPYMAAYYATKAYVVSLTRAVFTELAQHKSHIYLGALCPGPVDTEFNDRANVLFALKGISSDECVDYAIAQMKKRKKLIVPTLAMRFITTFGRFLPMPLLLCAVSKQQKRKIGK